MNKRGEDSTASGAAAFVALLAVFVVLYILFVPEEFRQEILLGETGDTFSAGTRYGNILTKTPGKLERLTSTVVHNSLPSVVLYEDIESQILASSRTLLVENGLFTESKETLSFEIDDVVHTDNVLLSFNVKQADGRLVVTLNDRIIFNSLQDQNLVNPIRLPKELLQRNNVLEFRVAGAGARFWHTTRYLIETVQVTADVTDVGKLRAKTNFVITSEDLLNSERVVLQYLPECQPQEVGILDVTLNSALVSSSVPLCGDLTRLDIAPSTLRTGQNMIEFKTARGSYIIDRIDVIQYLKQPTLPSYYFEITNAQFNSIRNTNIGAILNVKLLSPEFKNLVAYVNGHPYYIQGSQIEFSFNVENAIGEGTNAIKLVPRSKDIDVISLTLAIE